MERLTEKRDGKNVIPLRQDGKVKWALCSAGKGDAPTEYLYGIYADVLAAYEDTGLTPEKMLQIDKDFTAQAKELYEYKQKCEKLNPKTPDLEGDGYDREGNIIYDTWICPNCGEYYEVDYDNYDYCPKCGQAIDWSDL